MYVATLHDMVKKDHSDKVTPELRPKWGERKNQSCEALAGEGDGRQGIAWDWEFRKHKGTGVGGGSFCSLTETWKRSR